MMDESEVEKLIESVRAVERQIGEINRVLDGLGKGKARDALIVARKSVEAIRDGLKREIAKSIEGEGWKLSKGLIRALIRIGIDVRGAFGAVGEGAAERVTGAAAEGVARTIGTFIGNMLGAIFLVLTNPSEIGGKEERVVDSVPIKIEGKRYRLVFFQTRWTDEIGWSDISARIEEELGGESGKVSP